MAVAADTWRAGVGAPADTDATLSAGQHLALKYFLAAMVLFLAQTVFGLLAGLQFIYPEFLFGVLDFNVNRMVHLNAMIVWMLYGFIGSIYWLVEDEAGTDLVGAKLANINFWILTAAVTVVVAVYLVVQVGSGTRASIWLINEGREYIEAPRWADIGIVACMGVFFSALEPIPLVAMVVHAVYDAGRHGFRSNNHPALAWLIAHAFGNFLGAGVWGFMQTLPQINLYTHGTQWSASHGHLAFFGAYTTIVIAFIYIALQKWRGDVWMSGDLPDGGWKWKWALGLQCVGMLGMTMAMLIAGYEQAFVERAIGGSTWQAFFEGQTQPWFVQAMYWRMAFGVVMTAGLLLLFWDLLSIGSNETRPAKQVHALDEEHPAKA